MAGVLAIYGLVIAIIIAGRIEKPPNYTMLRYAIFDRHLFEGPFLQTTRALFQRIRPPRRRYDHGLLRIGRRMLYRCHRRLLYTIDGHQTSDLHERGFAYWICHGFGHVRSDQCPFDVYEMIPMFRCLNFWINQRVVV